jgi:hypothetical protein
MSRSLQSAGCRFGLAVVVLAAALLLVVHQTQVHASDPFKRVGPSQSGPKVPVTPPGRITGSLEACTISGISARYGPPLSVLTVTGTGMDQGCVVEFATPGTAMQAIQNSTGPTEIKVQIPNFPVGTSLKVTTYKTPMAGQEPKRGKTFPFAVTAPGANACKATGISPTTAKWTDYINITGANLDHGCAVDFVDPQTNRYPLVPWPQSGNLLRAQIPNNIPLISGRVVVYPKSAAGSPPSASSGFALTILTPNPTAGECEPVDVSPWAGPPGTEVILTGNKGMNTGCKVFFYDSSGARYAARTQPVSPSKLKAWVPLMPPGNGIVWSVPAKTIYFYKVEGLSFVVNESVPVLTAVNPSSGQPGDVVTLTGDAFFPPHNELRVRLQYLPSKHVDLVPSVQSHTQMRVTLPVVFFQGLSAAEIAAMTVPGKITVLRRTITSASLPFQIKPKSSLSGAPKAGFLGEVTQKPKVVFAHMINTITAVDWAMGLGVNGLEMDLRFNSNNMPSEFRHSTPDISDPCDCSAGAAYLAKSDNVCKHMGTSQSVHSVFPCHARTPAAKMLEHLVQPRFANRLAVVYIDSKIDKSDAPPNLSTAGKNVIQFLDANLFAKGYLGQVVISAGETKYSDYIKAAVAAAGSSLNRMRYFFAYDGQSSSPNVLPSSKAAATDFKRAVQGLIDLGTPNRVYSVGIAAIMPGTFYDQMSLATYNRKTGVLSGTGIWTLDNKDSMKAYLNFGVDSIMTNVPGEALQLFREWGIALAKPREALLPATSNNLTVKLPAGEICESNSLCSQGACGRGTAADGALKICCPSGKVGLYAGYEYCYGMPDGSVCWSDVMCATRFCRGNRGGTKKGVCGKLDAGQPCDTNPSCKNGACGRGTAADGAPKICCPSGKVGLYAGYEYCYGMPDGSVCWSDVMCASHNCKGNSGGLKKGRCK